jgi:peptide/nickel transport system permease protein
MQPKAKSLNSNRRAASRDAAQEPRAIDNERADTRLPPARPRRKPGGSLVTGLIVVALVVIAVYAGPLALPHGPLAQDLSDTLQPPSAAHWLGTDNFGRDLLARVLYAGRTDLQIGVIATCISLAIGTIVGAIAAYYGGWVDAVFMRILDVTMAFPRMVLVIAIVALLGPGTVNIYIALTTLGWVIYARLIRGQVLAAKEMEYILAARAVGVTDRRIIIRHLLPNTITPAWVFAMSNVVLNMLFTASLSFLGLGIQPPHPEWGTMIAEGRAFMLTTPWLTILPGLAVVITGLGVTLLGEGLVHYTRQQH